VVPWTFIQTPVLNHQALEPGGFVSHELRQVIWPKIMGLNRFSVGEFEHYVRPNPQTDQIGRDVDRSLWQFTANNAKRKRRGARRKTLREVPVAALGSPCPWLPAACVCVCVCPCRGDM
jgi:hypothetical protein